MTTADVRLYDTIIGAISWDPLLELGIFEYHPDFLQSGIEVSPVMMPLGPGQFSFANLPRETFKGLPGLLADSLPDKFGNLLIDQWLASQGRTPQSFHPVERLCYLGSRAMGALEFQPSLMADAPSERLEIDALVALANDALDSRKGLRVSLDRPPEALATILQVGTSAGGARAQAVSAWTPATGEIRSGQVPMADGFEPWLLKFDGVSGNRDKELADPTGYGRIEYAYHLMARQAGIEMSDCHLLEENGRAHFMTRRFDRDESGRKFHIQSLCGIAHFDFNQAGAYAYEQAFQIGFRLGLPEEDITEMFRRAVFNILSRNQDDHTKNIAFIMDRRGRWRLAPAFDVVYSYNPSGAWTSRHQMSLNGKRDDFTPDDFIAAAAQANLKPAKARKIISMVRQAVLSWPKHAEAAGVANPTLTTIRATLRA